jgi:tRNA A37 threonylcarbamoyltransferase TsaD
LSYKLLNAAGEKWVQTILLAGGVSANIDLNMRISSAAQEKWYTFFAPKKKIYSMDNAAMIGILAYYRVKYEKYKERVWTVMVGEKPENS